VIDTVTNAVVGRPIFVGTNPFGVAVTATVTPDGSKVYVAERIGGTVSVIDTATNTVIGLPITVGSGAFGVAATSDGSKVFVTNNRDNTVSVIDTTTNTAVGLPITVGKAPTGVSVTPDGSKVFVANLGDGTVSVIDTVTNTVVAVLPVGAGPFAFGVFIQPRFAGTPGHRNCHRKSIVALAQTFGGLNGAAIALGFPTLHALQTAVNAFCGDSACDEGDRRACMIIGENREHRAGWRREHPELFVWERR
jgi:YVTN family beta-propeller protein